MSFNWWFHVTQERGNFNDDNIVSVRTQICVIQQTPEGILQTGGCYWWRRQQGRGDNALNNVYSNGYAQPNERTSWRHPLRLDGKGMAQSEDNLRWESDSIYLENAVKGLKWSNPSYWRSIHHSIREEDYATRVYRIVPFSKILVILDLVFRIVVVFYSSQQYCELPH